jgi:hypothetical protein
MERGGRGEGEGGGAAARVARSYATSAASHPHPPINPSLLGQSESLLPSDAPDSLSLSRVHNIFLLS